MTKIVIFVWLSALLAAASVSTEVSHDVAQSIARAQTHLTNAMQRNWQR